MKRYANAKVNLALDVLETTPEGYHLLDMIMAPVSLADVIEMERAGQDAVWMDGVPAAPGNTVWKALDEFEKAAGRKYRYEIHVQKEIPEQAGLAGGSADAAAVLHLLNEMEDAGLSAEQLDAIGARVGADVPFCLHSRYARVQGIGEKVRELDTDWEFEVLLVKPPFGISTPACFARWDQEKPVHYDIGIVEDAICSRNRDLLYQTMENALETPAMELEPELARLQEKMLETGLVRVLMTGSGSALLGFSVDRPVLEAALEQMKNLGMDARIVTVGKGVEA